MGRVTRVDEVAVRSARRIRATILEQLQLASPLVVSVALGCSANPPDGDDGGVTTDPSTSNGSSASEGESESEGGMDEGPGTATDSDTGPETETGDDGPIKLDVPPEDPLCTSEWHDPELVNETFPGCELGPYDPDLWVEFVEVCIEIDEGESCDDYCTADYCEGMQDCWWFGEIYDTCGVFESPGSCCVLVAGEPPPPVGRPFEVRGQLRLAQVEAPGLAAGVAAHWLEMARGEHASIAAFARFVALLLAHRAPPRLVADALAAASDEVRHTRDALRLASRFAGRELALGSLEVARANAELEDLGAAVRAAVLEGCVGETLAAHEAACLAAHARERDADAEVAEVLRRIADDEGRHAALAWRFVAWALEARPELRPVVEEAFACALGRAPVGESGGESGGEEERALAWGYPSPRLRTRWREVARDQLVRPCAAALLGSKDRASAWV